jgi:hypothetical protein
VPRRTVQAEGRTQGHQPVVIANQRGMSFAWNPQLAPVQHHDASSANLFGEQQEEANGEGSVAIVQDRVREKERRVVEVEEWKSKAMKKILKSLQHERRGLGAACNMGTRTSSLQSSWPRQEAAWDERHADEKGLPQVQNSTSPASSMTCTAMTWHL